MTVRLALHATVTQLIGWGRASPPKAVVRIELRDPGELAVVRLGRLRDQELLRMSITGLRLTTGNEQVNTGGGFIGGGLGVRGAIAGMVTAGALNRMTRQRYEHTLLTATEALPNGARRQATFAFATMSESELRDHLAASLDEWADAYIAAATCTPDPLGYGDQLDAAYAQIDRMRRRGMLTATHALTLASHTSRPRITALVGRLDAHQIGYDEAQQLTERIIDLEREQRISPDQARQLHDRLLQIPAPPSTTPNGRIAQLQALAELRQTGALTEDEFQAEKHRILHQAE